MNPFLVTIVLLVILIVVVKVKQGMDRQKKIMNILHGKHTFDALGIDDKNSVVAAAFTILKDGGVNNAKERIDNLNDAQKYGVYALAMAELDIKPRITNYSWSYVRNPIIISKQEKRDLEIGIELFTKDHAVELNLETSNV